jgi:cytochrome c nitrite reductase small subunit
MMAVTGMLCGLALVAFRTSNAASYLSDDPTACINCHVMVPYYASWERSSHRQVATCNDCHVPQDNKLRTLWFKGMDGLRHATVFTLRREPQTLRLNPAAVPVVQQNCVRCHTHQVMYTNMGSSQRKRNCWDCHREVPHGLTQSLSSTPHVRHPTLPSAGIPLRQDPPAGASWRIFEKDDTP